MHEAPWCCAGIALGGGLGIGANRVGPSVDNVLGIDVVNTWENSTVDWDIVRINATSHPDLFWGMLVGPHCSIVLFCCVVVLPVKAVCAGCCILTELGGIDSGVNVCNIGMSIAVCGGCTLLSLIGLGL